MTLLTQAESCLKDTFIKASFMLVNILLDIKKILEEKALLNFPLPNILK